MKQPVPCRWFAGVIRLTLVAAAALPTIRADVIPDQPVIPNHLFNVKDHGAVGDGVATNTTVIQATINAASAAGGGLVEIPAGIYLCGPLQLASQINLRVDQGATLRMLPLKQYPGGIKDPKTFISGEKLHDIAISGRGTIDGQGADWWPYAKTDASAVRPRMIHLGGCDRVLIENVTLLNSPMFHIGIRSDNVTVRGVTVRAPASTDPVTPSHNTDACDVSGNHILVQNCDISVGDDDFTCGGHTSNVLIAHCSYGNGHGLSIGSYTQGWVSNLTVIDCTFSNTDTGIRIKSDRDRGGFVHDVTYRDLRMTNVGTPIEIYGAYHRLAKPFKDLNDLTGNEAATFPAKTVTSLTPFYQNLMFSNITATVRPGHRAGLIFGLPEASVTNVLLQNVSITADKPFGIFYAQGVRVVDCKITTPAGVNIFDTTRAQVSVRSQ